MLYNITDTLTNKVYQYEGERAPSQEELTSLIGPSPETMQAAQTLATQPQPQGENINPEAIPDDVGDPRQQAILSQKKKMDTQNQQSKEMLPSGIQL
jgi:hypothetical protein